MSDTLNILTHSSTEWFILNLKHVTFPHSNVSKRLYFFKIKSHDPLLLPCFIKLLLVFSLFWLRDLQRQKTHTVCLNELISSWIVSTMATPVFGIVAAQVCLLTATVLISIKTNCAYISWCVTASWWANNDLVFFHLSRWQMRKGLCKSFLWCSLKEWTGIILQRGATVDRRGCVIWKSVTHPRLYTTFILFIMENLLHHSHHHTLMDQIHQPNNSGYCYFVRYINTEQWRTGDTISYTSDF